MFNKESVLYYIFEEILSSGRCSIDTYAESNLYGETLSEYTALKNFNLHSHLPIGQLIDEIQFYDYGLCLQDYRGVDTDSMSAQKYILPTKIFTYLSAGLPVILSKQYEEACRFVTELGVGIVLDGDTFSDTAEKLDAVSYSEMKENIMKFQKSNIFQKEKEKLTDFIIKTIQG